MKKFIRVASVASVLWLGMVTATLADFDSAVSTADSGDFETAYKEFKSLADQGDASSQYNLGVMYANGLGVAQDYKEAVKWYQKAAEQGFVDAQYNLGVRYDSGKGVAKAQSNLGLMYDNGTGVLNDNVRAHMWFNVAGANGNKIGADNRTIIEIEMTSAQISKAQKLARQWMEKHR